MGLLNIFRSNECVACSVRKEWQIDKDTAIERQRLIYESRISHLENLILSAQHEVKEYQQIILKYARLVPSLDTPRAAPTHEPVRIGKSWTGVKAQLEKEALKKAEYWANKSSKPENDVSIYDGSNQSAKT